MDSLETPNLTPGSLVAQHEEAIRLVESLEKIKKDYREVIELHHLQGLSLKEVAVRMGRTYVAVRKLHTRAMVSLGLHLSSEG